MTKQGTIHNLSGPKAIENCNYIHKHVRYRTDKISKCGLPDQDPDTACGFLEDPLFHYLYYILGERVNLYVNIIIQGLITVIG